MKTDEEWSAIARKITQAHAKAWDALVPVCVFVADVFASASDKCIEAANALNDLAAWRLAIGNDSRPSPAVNIILRLSREIGDAYTSRRAQFVVDWKRWRELGFTLNLDPNNQESNTLWLHVGPAALYLDLPITNERVDAVCAWMEERFGDTNPRHSELRRYPFAYSSRTISARVYRYDETHEPEWIWSSDFWNCNSIGYSDVEWWRHAYINLTNVVFGSEVITDTPLTSYDFDVPMPERVYKWHAKETRVVRHRPRWFGQSVYKSISLDALPGEHIPFPGKGENAWDCGMDGLFGCGAPGDTPRTELGAVVRRIAERDRARRGFTAQDAVQYTAHVQAKQQARATDPSSVEAANAVEAAVG